MNLHFDLNGPNDFKPQQPRLKVTRPPRAVVSKEEKASAEAERRRKVAEFNAEENARLARIHDEFCDLKERAKRFESVPLLDRVTTIAISGTTLISKTEGDILEEVCELFLVDPTDWLRREDDPEPEPE